MPTLSRKTASNLTSFLSLLQCQRCCCVKLLNFGEGVPMATKNVSKKQPERRIATRIPINIWVREERQDYYFLYKATDISEGGMFLEKKIEAPHSTVRSTFKFTLPKSSRLITVEGQVAFTAVSATSPRSGSGIKFVGVSNQDKKLITKFIHQS